MIILRAFLHLVRILELNEQPLDLCHLALAVVKFCLLVDVESGMRGLLPQSLLVLLVLLLYCVGV